MKKSKSPLPIIIVALFLTVNASVRLFSFDRNSIFRRARQIDFNQVFDAQQAASLLGQGVDNSSLLSTWRHIFDNYSGEKIDIEISFGRGQGQADTETISLPIELSAENQARFVALYIANELITKGAGAVKVECVSEQLKQSVRELFNEGGKYYLIVEYIMERYSSYFEPGAAGKHLFDMDFLDLNTAINTQNLPEGFVFDRNKKGVFLGLDIGASSMKLCIIRNGIVVFTKEIEQTLDYAGRVSISEAVDQEIGSFVTDSLKGFDEPGLIEGIGVSWPGGVLGNAIVAESKILKNLSGDKSEIIEAIGVTIFSILGGKDIPIALINDGDAGAFGITGDKEDVLGIILGTSIAGGYIDESGNIAPFVGELGKLIFDVSGRFIKSGRNLPESSVYVASEGLKNLIKAYGLESEISQVIGDLAKNGEIGLNKDQSGLDSISWDNLDNSQIGRGLRRLIDGGDKRALKIEEVIGIYLAEVIVEAQRHYGAGNIVIAGGILKALPHLEQHTKRRLDELYDSGLSGIDSDNVIFSDEETRYAGAHGAAQWANFIAQLQQYNTEKLCR